MANNLNEVLLLLAADDVPHINVTDANDRDVMRLVYALAWNKGLISLTLGNNELTNMGVVTLGNYIVTTQLQELYLTNNAIDNHGLCALVNSLPGTLVLLTLENNYIGNDGAAVFGSLLWDNKKLTQLTLNDNVIGDAGVRELAAGLSGNATLEEL